VRLIIIDLTNGLLTDRELTAARESAQEVLEALARRHRLAAFTESSESGVVVRDILEACGLAAFFETVTTSADIGEDLTPEVVRRIAGAISVAAHHTAVVTNRPAVAELLQMEGIVALLAEWDRPLSGLPESLAWMTALSPE
jgi:beta-phosphoglucomutase-like phosphatase (HAD superfamily)